MVLGLTTGLAAGPAAAQEFSTRAPADSVVIGARVHTQFNTSSAPATPGSEFLIRRARIWVSSRINETFDGVAQIEFAQGSARARYAFLRAWLHPAARVSAGQFKRSFDMFALSSSSLMLPVERTGRIRGVDQCAGVGSVCSYSQFSETLQYSLLDIGVMVEGDVAGERVSYRAGVTNGTGGNETEENGAKSVSAHAAFRPLAHVELGGGLSTHDYPDPGGGSDRHAVAWAVDAQVGDPAQGPRLKAGLMVGDNWRLLSPDGEEATFLAWQAVGGYRVPLRSALTESIEAVARITGGDPDRATARDGGLVWTPGVNLYLADRNKLSANVDVWRPASGPSAWSLKVQTQLYF